MKLKSVFVGVALFAFAGTAFAEPVILKLPKVGAQRTAYTCGPNAAARVLRFFNENVNPAALEGSCPKSVDLDIVDALSLGFLTATFPQYQNIGKIQVGPTPEQLAAHMNANSKDKKFAVNKAADLDPMFLMGEINNGNPVIIHIQHPVSERILNERKAQASGWALIRQVVQKPMLATKLSDSPYMKSIGLTLTEQDISDSIEFPYTHYVTINGYNMNEFTGGISFFYVDSDQNETMKEVSYEELEKIWKITAENSPLIHKLMNHVGTLGRSAVVVVDPSVAVQVATASSAPQNIPSGANDNNAPALINSVGLKLMPKQTQSWDCGPTAALSVLDFYNSAVADHGSFVSQCPVSLELLGGLIKLGPAPEQLVEYMNQNVKGNVEFIAQYGVKFEDIQREVAQKKPVMLLVKTGVQNQPFWKSFPKALIAGFINASPFAQAAELQFSADHLPNELDVPLLHYIVITGLEKTTRAGKTVLEYTFYDPSEGRLRKLSEEALYDIWNWNADSEFVSTVLALKNVQNLTMIVGQQKAQNN